jgi:hypothetical protein
MRDNLRNLRNYERVSRGELLRLRKGAYMFRISSKDQCINCLTSLLTDLLKSSNILSYGAECRSSRCSEDRVGMFPIFYNCRMNI